MPDQVAGIDDQVDPRQDRVPMGRRRKVAAGLLVGLPVSAIFLWLAVRDIELDNLVAALRNAEPAWLVATLLAIGAVYALQAERWRIIAARTAPASRTSFLRFVVCGVAVNNVVPGRPGEAFRGYWLSRSASVPFARAFASVVSDRMFDVATLVLMLLVTLPFVRKPDWLVHLSIGSVTIAMVVLAALSFLVVRRHRFMRPQPTSRTLRRRIQFQIAELLWSLPRLVTPSRAALAGLYSCLAWFAFATAAWFTATAVGINISVTEALFMTAILNLGSAIPSSPGFVGTYQWLAVAGLGLFAVPATEAFVFALLLQAAWFIPTTLAGFVIALTDRTMWRQPTDDRRGLRAPT